MLISDFQYKQPGDDIYSNSSKLSLLSARSRLPSQQLQSVTALGWYQFIRTEADVWTTCLMSPGVSEPAKIEPASYTSSVQCPNNCVITPHKTAKSKRVILLLQHVANVSVRLARWMLVSATAGAETCKCAMTSRIVICNVGVDRRSWARKLVVYRQRSQADKNQF